MGLEQDEDLRNEIAEKDAHEVTEDARSITCQVEAEIAHNILSSGILKTRSWKFLDIGWQCTLHRYYRFEVETDVPGTTAYDWPELDAVVKDAGRNWRIRLARLHAVTIDRELSGETILYIRHDLLTTTILELGIKVDLIGLRDKISSQKNAIRGLTDVLNLMEALNDLPLGCVVL